MQIKLICAKTRFETESQGNTEWILQNMVRHFVIQTGVTQKRGKPLVS